MAQPRPILRRWLKECGTVFALLGTNRSNTVFDPVERGSQSDSHAAARGVPDSYRCGRAADRNAVRLGDRHLRNRVSIFESREIQGLLRGKELTEDPRCRRHEIRPKDCWAD